MPELLAEQFPFVKDARLIDPREIGVFLENQNIHAGERFEQLRQDRIAQRPLKITSKCPGEKRDPVGDLRGRHHARKGPPNASKARFCAVDRREIPGGARTLFYDLEKRSKLSRGFQRREPRGFDPWVSLQDQHVYADQALDQDPPKCRGEAAIGRSEDVGNRIHAET